MRVYTFPQAANPRKLRIYLIEKQLDLETVEVSVPGSRHRQRAYLAANPMALVPILELDDGRSLSETDAIIEYLEELHPQPPLIGADPWSRAMTREVMTMAEHGLLDAALMAVEHSAPEYSDRIRQVPAIAEAVRARFGRVVSLFDTLLEHHEWLAGPSLTVADITALVGLELGLEYGCTLPASAQRIGRWLDRMRERPSVRAAK